MNRKDIRLSPEDYTKELRRELNMRWGVYAKQVQQKKLSQYEANKRYLIIMELMELMEAARDRGLSMSDLKQMVENGEIKATPKQTQLFPRTKFPN